jgi:hypothetical protein
MTNEMMTRPRIRRAMYGIVIEFFWGVNMSGNRTVCAIGSVDRSAIGQLGSAPAAAVPTGSPRELRSRITAPNSSPT